MKKTAIVAVMALLLAGCKAPPAKEIKIGLITPLTGDVKTYGESVKNSFEIAVEEANKAGGVAGMKIVTVVVDDRNDPTEASNAANLLIHQEKVKVIIGSVTSKASIPVSDLAQSSRIPTISPTATNPKVTVADGKRKDFVFRSCFIDPFQGKVMAKFARETLSKEKAAVLYDASNDYSKGIAEYFSDAFKLMGGKVVAYESYGKDDVDFSALLTKVRASGADVLFLPDYYNKVGLIAKQSMEKGIRATMIGPDGWDSPDLVKVAGDAIEGGYFSNHYSPDDTRPEVVAWVKKYKEKFGQTPDALGTLAYDGTNLMLEAIRKANSDDPVKIRETLASIKGFKGVTGESAMDDNGNAIKSAVILQIVNGKQKFVKVVNP
ncbi:MAG: branched-chain amino acid ABC transporter substrate-binding protein [Deltaproteobacteria bacterium RBG_16_64_85]|nr:MAG: branched-chain amino acid ABC transporter substrate-binding protein [Deltaproteobacteria bacterium RBG_16_64_85]